MKFLVEGQIVLLAGDAGIGKSRLVTASKAAATGTGYQILESSCFEPDRTVPSAPLIELLRTLRVELPELTSTHVHVHDPEQERFHLFRALVELVTRLARAQPVLLIVEDLQWCDDTSLEFLLYLARRLANDPLLLLLSYRLDEPRSGLRHLLAELDRQRLGSRRERASDQR